MVVCCWNAPLARFDRSAYTSESDWGRRISETVNPAGFTVSEIRRPQSDSLVYAERSNLASGAFQQQTTIVMEPASGTVRQVDQVTTQGGQNAETHLTYASGRVKGASAAPQPDGSVKRFEIDTALPPGTVDENAVPFVVPALPLAPGKTFAMTFFTPSENAIKVLTFKVGSR